MTTVVGIFIGDDKQDPWPPDPSSQTTNMMEKFILLGQDSVNTSAIHL